MSDWKIRRVEASCTACERTFEEGEAHFSILLVGADGLARQDQCAVCFEARDAGGPEELVWWRTRRRLEEKKALIVDFDAVEALFLALEGREEGRLRELRFLLCLLLMRKRRVKLARVVRRDGDEVMLVRRPRRQEELSVSVFDLTPERAEELRAELERIFEGAGAEDLLAAPPTGAALDDPADDPEDEESDSPGSPREAVSGDA